MTVENTDPKCAALTNHFETLLTHVWGPSTRKWRDKYYKKYLVGDMILSTSKKNVKKFLLCGCDCFLADTFSWKAGEETLNLFKASLYLEDTVTHKVYNHLANRFYEALYCNCAVFFDKNCERTITLSNYLIDEYFIVDSYDELMYKVRNLDQDKVDKFLFANTILALTDKDLALDQINKFLKETIWKT